MPSISSLQPAQQLALAQIRVELSHIAPEIPEAEILPDSELYHEPSAGHAQRLP